jgi:hypothetical protein
VEASKSAGGWGSWFWGSSSKPAAEDSSAAGISDLAQLDKAFTQEEKQRLYEAIGYQGCLTEFSSDGFHNSLFS